MDYSQMLENARNAMGGKCHVCPVCNGKACKNNMPGPGAKGSGEVSSRNHAAWQNILINMDTIGENFTPDTAVSLFGRQFSAPIFAAPVGALKMHYGDKHDDNSYNNILVPACSECGIAAFTGDGVNADVFKSAAHAIAKSAGVGIPTVKPWGDELVFEKIELAKGAGAMAIAMDIDAAGLPFLKNLNPPAGSKTVQQLAAFARLAGVPFIVKGIMTVRGAQKALAAGAYGIVVSNHGGRVLDGTPSTCEVLPDIAKAVSGSKMKIFVDGGIRTGVDVFKALALGADAVLIARPYVTAVYGGGGEGVRLYTEKLRAELSDTMSMCGAKNLADITEDMIF